MEGQLVEDGPQRRDDAEKVEKTRVAKRWKRRKTEVASDLCSVRWGYFTRGATLRTSVDFRDSDAGFFEPSVETRRPSAARDELWALEILI